MSFKIPDDTDLSFESAETYQSTNNSTERTPSTTSNHMADQSIAMDGQHIVAAEGNHHAAGINPQLVAQNLQQNQQTLNQTQQTLNQTQHTVHQTIHNIFQTTGTNDDSWMTLT